jgi:hypothetical protein
LEFSQAAIKWSKKLWKSIFHKKKREIHTVLSSRSTHILSRNSARHYGLPWPWSGLRALWSCLRSRIDMGSSAMRSISSLWIKAFFEMFKKCCERL